MGYLLLSKRAMYVFVVFLCRTLHVMYSCMRFSIIQHVVYCLSFASLINQLFPGAAAGVFSKTALINLLCATGRATTDRQTQLVTSW